MWKTAVEKSVENVENYELSTGISLFWFFPTSCGILCIPVCITRLSVPSAENYVTMCAPTKITILVTKVYIL